MPRDDRTDLHTRAVPLPAMCSLEVLRVEGRRTAVPLPLPESLIAAVGLELGASSSLPAYGAPVYAVVVHRGVRRTMLSTPSGYRQ